MWGYPRDLVPQDPIALDADEEKAIELKRDMIDGQERVVWNPTLSIPAKDFDFTDQGVARLKIAIQTWYIAPTPNRRWLQPIFETLFPTEPP